MSIKNENDFINYLNQTYKSRSSGKPLTPKVISDSIGRLNRIEMILNIKITNYFNTPEQYNYLKEMIKEKNKELINSTTNYKYGYSKYIYCIRLYYKFYCLKYSINLITPKDNRFNK